MELGESGSRRVPTSPVILCDFNAPASHCGDDLIDVNAGEETHSSMSSNHVPGKGLLA